MNVSVFAGDIADAPADAVCTSTNPRLSLMMGTGASIRGRGGFSILRECEAIVERNGGRLPPGSAHVTSAGALPHRVAIHCVACDANHRSSPEIIAACAKYAIAKAKAAGCSSIAMPVFGTGHAHVKFAIALRAMASAFRDLDVVVVVNDEERAAEAREILSYSATASNATVTTP